MTDIDVLLVIAAYLRKANHPTEDDAQLAAGVRADIAKIMRLRAAQEVVSGRIPETHATEYLDAIDGEAIGYEEPL